MSDLGQRPMPRTNLSGSASDISPSSERRLVAPSWLAWKPYPFARIAMLFCHLAIRSPTCLLAGISSTAGRLAQWRSCTLMFLPSLLPRRLLDTFVCSIRAGDRSVPTRRLDAFGSWLLVGLRRRPSCLVTYPYGCAGVQPLCSPLPLLSTRPSSSSDSNAISPPPGLARLAERLHTWRRPHVERCFGHDLPDRRSGPADFLRYVRLAGVIPIPLLATRSARP